MNAFSGSESSAARARFLALLEDVELRGYSADTVDAAAQAVALAREIGDLELLSRALYCGLRTNLAAGEWGAAVDLGDEAASVCVQTQDRMGEYKARYLLGDARWRHGQITEAFVSYDHAGAIARGLGDVQRQVRCFNMMAYMLGALRDYPASLSSFDKALALCHGDDYAFDRALVVNNKAQMLINRAQESSERNDAVDYARAAQALLSPAMVETIRLVWPRGGLAARDTLGQCLVLLGSSDQALAMFGENAREAEATNDEIAKAQAGMGMAEALLGLGEPAEALKRCHALGGSEGTRLWPALLPRVENAAAKALYALGRHREAFDTFERYHTRLIRNNSRVAFQYMKFVELVVQLETSRAETEAYKKLAHELAVANYSAEGDPDEAEWARRFASLSAQQIRILLMVRAGRLNKQIAADLGIAEQTVKVHVSTILSKLHVGSRTQAAVVADRLVMPSLPSKERTA